MDVMLCLGQNITRLTRWIVINSGHINFHIQGQGAGNWRLVFLQIKPHKESQVVKLYVSWYRLEEMVTSINHPTLSVLWHFVSPHWAMTNSVKQSKISKWKLQIPPYCVEKHTGITSRHQMTHMKLVWYAMWHTYCTVIHHCYFEFILIK